MPRLRGITGTTTSASANRPPGASTARMRANRSAFRAVEVVDAQGAGHQIERPGGKRILEPPDPQILPGGRQPLAAAASIDSLSSMPTSEHPDGGRAAGRP